MEQDVIVCAHDALSIDTCNGSRTEILDLTRIVHRDRE